jgi:glycerol uptake facilitator-like aquaporin
MSLARRAFAESIATALLLAIVVGSGVMGERLAAGNVAIALLANSLATGCGLAALIVTFAPISGAHMNPAVTLALAMASYHLFEKHCPGLKRWFVAEPPAASASTPARQGFGSR